MRARNVREIREGCERRRKARGGTEISISGSLRGFERGSMLSTRGRDVMYTLGCKRSLEVRPIENRADCKVNNQDT